eukprot:25176-Eustigmatos_ZCMA.PRE.1
MDTQVGTKNEIRADTQATGAYTGCKLRRESGEGLPGRVLCMEWARELALDAKVVGAHNGDA